MKESLARIKAWAQKHPYLATAILLGVVALAYIAIKRGGGSGGGGGGSYGESQPEPGPDGETGLPLGLGSSGDTGQTSSGFTPVETAPASSAPVPVGLEAYTPPAEGYPVIPTVLPSGYPVTSGAPVSSPAMSYLVSGPTGQPAAGAHGPAPLVDANLKPRGGASADRPKRAVEARVTSTTRTPGGVPCKRRGMSPARPQSKNQIATRPLHP
jgi:hypothetical protein